MVDIHMCIDVYLQSNAIYITISGGITLTEDEIDSNKIYAKYISLIRYLPFF